ncbi:MAG: hypothetical protein PHU08_00120, partial [Dehalococcoidales bacterium]|nr:hypothetical protein [Dehalococcoidales bacterium]
MRILGFAKHWDKLDKDEFTTFRYPRGDRDWFVGEQVQVFIKPRSKDRVRLGFAGIVSKEDVELDPEFAEKLVIPLVSNYEARADGFTDRDDMVGWLKKTYGLDYVSRINKITLRWITRELAAGG